MQVRFPSSGFGSNGLSVNAVAGTNVVFLGLDASPDVLQGLLGFAIRRKDLTEEGRPDSDRWLSGQKVFKTVVPNPQPGHDYETDKHPVQSFLWSDYRAKPDHDYEFYVHAMHGTPSAPRSVAPTLGQHTDEVLGEL